MVVGKKVRIKILDKGLCNPRYIVVDKGTVSFYSASEVPLALSNLASDHAAELRFALEDAKSAEEALKSLRELVPGVNAEIL